MTRAVISAAAVLAVAGVAAAWVFRPSFPVAPMADAVSVAQGKVLYAEYCASCHGANLEGQPNWRSPGEDGRLPAPPHDETGHTWHHSDRMLFEYTKLGGQAALANSGVALDSGMPGFGSQLSDAQIRGILNFIKSAWPEREQRYQAERTEVEAQQEGRNQ
ncbi:MULTISPECIES: c-type cytochrome [Leisingera]|uniref:Cytochrome c n=2 Tax=Leisingera TaxID=191028 RepID=A0ABY5WQZ8_9RHOB|nr:MULTISPECIES: cytochrome c [Leisingera]KIC31494.1 cytochrome C [Leisingera sp. ANG-S5]UWQ43951.1 cytochrome c [Leisingera aquaemixtae]